MREIKFRAWDNKKKRWADDFLIQDDGTLCRYGCFETLEPVHDHVLMQFSGLLDKNGKEVFEGDTVKYTAEDDRGPSTWVVSFEDGRFGLSSSRDFIGLHYPSSTEIEVIGNIYESGQLKAEIERVKGEKQ